jgi:hypothetical protein
MTLVLPEYLIFRLRKTEGWLLVFRLAHIRADFFIRRFETLPWEALDKVALAEASDSYVSRPETIKRPAKNQTGFISSFSVPNPPCFTVYNLILGLSGLP